MHMIIRHVRNDLASRPLNKGILDGPLLQSFVALPKSKQDELAGPIGTDRETVLHDLMDLTMGGETSWVW